ncbi:MAG: NRDE family protein [Parasphingorhabdus sp.]|uniref:NRDE family protein n=2 Tax=Parasphingorhabdus sp. TaxID=2709688 RepID=UPI003265283A
MCIISLAWQAHPNWKLIAIGNRDEMHGRPAQPLDRWTDHDHMLAGRDVQAGGTWLGVSEQGRFAVVTNVSSQDSPDRNRASRGDLLRDFLSGDGRCSKLDAVSFSDFNPFNLITIENDVAIVHSNRPDSISRSLAPGIHGLSNGPLEKPWEKAKHLDAALERWLESHEADPTSLLDVLTNQSPYPLKGEAQTDLPTQFEPQSSGIFIKNPVYGTRCSTIVAIDHQGRGSITERRYAASAEVNGESRLSFSWPA